MKRSLITKKPNASAAFNFINRMGLAMKLSVISTIIISIVMGLLAYGFYFYQKNKLKSYLTSELQTVIKIAQTSLAYPLWSFDSVAANNTTAALIQEQKSIFLAIRVRDIEGKDFAKVKHPKVENDVDFDYLFKNPNIKIVYSDIDYQGKKIGSIEVAYSSLSLDNDIKSVLLLTYIFVFTVALLVCALLFYINNSLLKIPLSKLVVLANEIREGFYLRLEPSQWKHEFHEIALSFNAAMKAILLRDEALKRHTDNLERLVDERSKELDQKRMQLINASRLASLGEFSSGMAHEINDPLSIIQGKTFLINKFIETNPSAEPIVVHVEKISAMIDRITKIINGLRAFAHKGSNEKTKEFPLSRLLINLEDLIQAKLNQAMIKWQMVNPYPGIFVLGREVQMSQVLINLINNSIDAIENLDEKWIEVKIELKSDVIRIRVTDSGNGIPIEIRDKIMQPFFTTKETGKGTGLGLSISYGIMIENKGKLFYDEHYNHTSFLVEIPRVDLQ